MKQFVISILAAAYLSGAACYAEDGSTQNAKEFPPASDSKETRSAVIPTKPQQVARAKHALLVGNHHRNWYYVRAGRSPWWPNAPGD